jgi:hypothetical protein
MLTFKAPSQVLFAILLTAQLQAQHSPLAGEKKALVMGNANYLKAGHLNYPINDARRIADVLKEVDYQVTLVEDADLKQMQDSVIAFVRSIRPGDLVFFYFSGHGAQDEEGNYLIPKDFSATDLLELRYRAYKLEDLRNMLNDSGAKIKVLLIDACSDDPFIDRLGGDRGFHEMQGGPTTLIGFAASPGQRALEICDGQNGCFTKHLLRNLPNRSASIWEALLATQKGVLDETTDKAGSFSSQEKGNSIKIFRSFLGFRMAVLSAARSAWWGPIARATRCRRHHALVI